MWYNNYVNFFVFAMPPENARKNAPIISPNINPRHAEPGLTTGQRIMGNLLVLPPVMALLTLLVVGLFRHYALGAEFLWWVLPLACEVVIDMLSVTWPVYPLIWLLCALGDALVKRGIPGWLVWSVVVLLCLAGCWLLLLTIPAACIYTVEWYTLATHILYMLSTCGVLLWLMCRRKSLVPRRALLKGLYLTILIFNSVLILWAWKDGSFYLRNTADAVGRCGPRAEMHNPLLD